MTYPTDDVSSQSSNEFQFLNRKIVPAAKEFETVGRQISKLLPVQGMDFSE